MAKLIPDIDPKTIENNGERAFYTSATSLPDDYTVLYSFKYKDISDGVDGEIRETDFIIVHPALGFLVVEVKQGDIAYIDGAWQELKKNGYQPLHKNPVEQARKAMYSVLDQYKAKANNRPFPLKIRYAVAFPECNKIAGKPPSDLDEKSIFLFGDLDNLENKILDLFAAGEKRQEREAIDLLLNKILAPIFKIFARLEDKIEMHNQRVERTMTEEQERILEETELDDRKIFFGGAGSGKTFLAMEKARRIAKEGKKVLLTCYNRNLANCLFGTIESPYITARNFHDFLEKALGDRVLGLKESLDYETYFARGLPDLGFEYFSTLDEEEKFDAIIVDEAVILGLN